MKNNNTFKNRGTGAGGQKTNLHGKHWENKFYLKDIIESFNEFKLEKIAKINAYKIYNQKKLLIGYYGRQGCFYKVLKFINDKIDDNFIKSKLSKKIHPDSFIINIKLKKVFIFEKKWQQNSGSVDEKIQTGDFKVKMFEKILKEINYQIQYIYILSEWFKNKQYKNVREYYQKYVEDPLKYALFTKNLDLDNLDINDYLK